MTPPRDLNEDSSGVTGVVLSGVEPTFEGFDIECGDNKGEGEGWWRF
jgi:hypothetical protein